MLQFAFIVYRYAADNFPEFMDKLKKFGARYKRTLPAEDDPESPIGRSFYNAYQVDNKIDLEKKLNKIAGLEYEWMPEGSLTVTTEPIPGELDVGTFTMHLVSTAHILPRFAAVKMIEQQHRHGIYQWTFHNSVIAAFLGWEDCRNDRTKAVCFGNDDAMDPSILASIATFMDQNKVSYQWKKVSAVSIFRVCICLSTSSHIKLLCVAG